MIDRKVPTGGNFPATRLLFGGLVKVSVPSGGEPGAVGEYGWGGWASTNFWVDPLNNFTGLVFTQVIQHPGDPVRLELTPVFREVVYRALESQHPND